MTDVTMTEERVAALIDAFGASPERWPDAERHAALALLAQSSSARARLADARALDLMLDAAPVEQPSRALEERIMAARPRPALVRAAPQPVQKPGFSLPKLNGGFFASLWASYGSAALPTGMLAASIILGMGLGSTVNTTALLNVTSVTSSATTMVASNDAAGDQLLALAMSETNYTEEMIR